MATGSNFTPSVQTFSHCSSWGQTRPQTAGNELVSLMHRAASPYFPSEIRPMNPGMSTLTGQPATQGFFGQCRQRDASSRAVCSS